MTIPELDENKHDFFIQKTRARDITKRRGAIKVIQRLTFVNFPFDYSPQAQTYGTYIFTEFTKLMATNSFQNFSASPRSVRIAKSFYGDLIR